ncbi:MAG TPA: hypothetical protein PKD26_03525 [Pyrinomonadaceae bacterium]|nr:hypothetical protein [Pyrinomonadaceae bacterium]
MNRPCPRCNQMNPPDAAFCLNCSTPLGPTVGGPGYQQTPPPYVGSQQQGPVIGGPAQYGGGQNFAPQGGTGQGPSGRAIAALILAISALVLCCGPLTGIPSAILGWLELEAIKNGQASPAGKWMAQVGLWGGIALTILGAIGFVVWILLSMMAASNPYAY